MKVIFSVIVGIAFLHVAWADTVVLKSGGAQINGTVTFSNGSFRIVAEFRARQRQISIGRDGVDEISFNNVTVNPEDDAPAWVLSLPKDSLQRQAQDTVRFWDKNE